MKKILRYVLISITLFTSLASFSACTGNINPTVKPDYTVSPTVLPYDTAIPFYTPLPDNDMTTNPDVNDNTHNEMPTIQ